MFLPSKTTIFSPEQWVEGLDKRWAAFGLQVQMSGCHHKFELYVDDMIFFSSHGQADNVSVENGKIVAADEPAKIDEPDTCGGSDASEPPAVARKKERFPSHEDQAWSAKLSTKAGTPFGGDAFTTPAKHESSSGSSARSSIGSDATFAAASEGGASLKVGDENVAGEPAKVDTDTSGESEDTSEPAVAGGVEDEINGPF
ncbi:expressed unknown protein [Seminavis robusta]|uniref:Uncharacterized protein n=1 Tax=Seminavis robusta TaxID=568900 RepID=A0A9N8E4Z1_9STRA|nr:expressed unknown protein [Seminavis robusta]|eukprot:Sro547_g164210.1 n/a (200) ;mRNA; r:28182-29378